MIYSGCDLSYVKREDEKETLIGVFVDDLAVATNDKSSVEWLRHELSSRYKLHDYYGELKIFLRFEIERDWSMKTILMS